MSVLTTSSDLLLGVLISEEGKKNIYNIYTRKEELKLSVLIDDMIVYVEYSLQCCYSKCNR